jgi:hypothetical protein
VRKKPIAESEQRGFDAVTQPLAGRDAFLLAGLAPAFERAVGRQRPGRAKAARVQQQPERREISEQIGFEDAAEISLDISRPGEARVIAGPGAERRWCTGPKARRRVR